MYFSSVVQLTLEKLRMLLYTVLMIRQVIRWMNLQKISGIFTWDPMFELRIGKMLLYGGQEKWRRQGDRTIRKL